MSRCNWLSCVALVGICLALPAQAKSIHPSASSHSRANGAQAVPKYDAKPSLPIAVQNDIHGIAAALDAANKKQPSATETKRENGNLKAQRKMARWAKWMFFVGAFEALITLAGVVLVWLTLNATWGAKREAERAADAAEKSLKQTEAHGKQGMRAYVDSEKRIVRKRGAGVLCEIRLRNSGQTPAYGLTGSFRTWVDTFPTPQQIPPDDSPTPVKWGTINIGPGAKTTFYRGIAFSSRDNTALANGSKVLWCSGRADYLDAFGEKRFVEFRSYLSASDFLKLTVETPQRMSIAKEGNEAN